MSESLIFLVINACLYTLVWVRAFRTHGMSVGLLLWSLFTISAWSSVALWVNPNFVGTVHDNEQNPVALLFLFALIWVCLSPLFKVSKLPKGPFTLPYQKTVLVVMTCLALYQILAFFVDLPKAGQVLDPTTDLADTREDAYGDTSEASSVIYTIPLFNRINLLYVGIQPLFIAFSMLLFFCYEKHRGLVIFFCISALMGITITILTLVSRGAIVQNALLIGLTLFYVRDYLNPRLKRLLVRVLLPTLVIGGVFFWQITVSRFEDLAIFFLVKYAGEPMVNFGGILFDDIQEYGYGTIYFLSPFLRHGENTIDKWDYIMRLTTIPGYIFYTFIGGLLMEFGRVGVVIISLIIGAVERYLIHKQQTSTPNFAFLILMLFWIYFYSYGVFLLPTQAITGDLMLLYIVILYLIFRKKGIYEVRPADIR